MLKKLRVVFTMALLFASISACALFGSQVTVGENERGVVADDQGNFQVLQPGTHTLSPLAGKAVIYPLTDQVYTMTGELRALGSGAAYDAVESLSKDGRQLWIDSAVTFRFVESKLPDMHHWWNGPQQFVDGFIRPTTRNVVYNTASQYNYEEVISSKRSEVEAAMSQQLAEMFAQQGIELVKLTLLDVRGQ